MNSILYLGNLLWFPRTLQPVNPRPNRADATNIGLIAGIAGLCAYLAWMIPPDYVRVSTVPAIETLANAAVGAAAGLLMIVMLFVFEALVLGLAGFRGFSRAIKGALGVFLLVPAACMPVRAWFPDGLSVAGYQVLFWILAGFFLGWHASVLFTLLPSSHYAIKQPAFVARPSRAWILGIALAGVELLMAIIFFHVIPMAFKSDFAEFMVVWI